MGFDCRAMASKLEIKIQNAHFNARSTHTSVDALEMEESGTLHCGHRRILVFSGRSSYFCLTSIQIPRSPFQSLTHPRIEASMLTVLPAGGENRQR